EDKISEFRRLHLETQGLPECFVCGFVGYKEKSLVLKNGAAKISTKLIENKGNILFGKIVPGIDRRITVIFPHPSVKVVSAGFCPEIDHRRIAPAEFAGEIPCLHLRLFDRLQARHNRRLTRIVW